MISHVYVYNYDTFRCCKQTGTLFVCMHVCLFGLANLRERVTLMYTALIRHGWSQQVAPSLSCIASTQHVEFI